MGVEKSTSLPTRDAETLLREFYLSPDYDPKAERHADTVKAAIKFTIRTLSTPTSGEASAPPPLREDYAVERTGFARLLLALDAFFISVDERHDSGGKFKYVSDWEALTRLREAWREVSRMSDASKSPTPAESVAGAREDVGELLVALEKLLPISWDNEVDGSGQPSHANLTFGEHSTQAMTLDPETWMKLNKLPDVLAALASSPTEQMLREALEAIIDRGPERDIKWAGMTARDIARQALERNQS